jgi:hypothetical protein
MSPIRTPAAVVTTNRVSAKEGPMSRLEAVAFAILILVALVAIGALFYVFLVSDDRA